MGGAKQPVHAAGALVWRLHAEELEVLLVHRPRYDDWSWPKGKLHKHESLPAAAVREVEEETGVAILLGTPLPTVSYRLSSGARKVCHYWAAREAQEPQLDVVPRPGVDPCTPDEVDEARWVGAVHALEMLTRRADRAPLMRLLELHADGLLDTWPVLITRHGRAVRRSAWKGGEDSRPLTATGEKQARSLMPIFAAFGVTRLLTSPWARCNGTVLPYAEADGAPVVLREELTEEAARRVPARARAVIEELLRERQPPTVVCTHRPVLPAALAALGAHGAADAAGRLPAADPYLRTAEVLVVHLGRRARRTRAGLKKARVVAVELHRGRS